MDKAQRRVIIVGGGIIGCSVAFQLCLRGYTPIVVERAPNVAPGASGKAGGFLAKTWNDRSRGLSGLTRRSYELHAEHANLFPSALYRKMDTWSASVHSESSETKTESANLEWLNKKSVSRLKHLSGEDTTAQVHPRLYTEAIADECWKRGATLVRGEAKEMKTDGGVQKLVVENSDGISEILEGDIIVICMGSWSDTLLKPLFGRNVMGGVKATSIVLKPSGEVPNVALFTEWLPAFGEDPNYDPEVYPRSDGTVYICARSETVSIPKEGPEAVQPEEATTSRMIKYASLVTPLLKDVPVVTTQACILPVAEDDLPIIGLIEPGIFVATGHSCWGILNAPATGEAMAQLIHEGKSVIDLKSFNPRRFML